jgi:hypothetical protein
VIEGRTRFLIFHLSWSQNKDNKIKYFQQLGEWRTTGPEDAITTPLDCSGLDCYCLSEPNLKCHCSDTLSKIACKSIIIVWLFLKGAADPSGNFSLKI